MKNFRPEESDGNMPDEAAHVCSITYLRVCLNVWYCIAAHSSFSPDECGKRPYAYTYYIKTAPGVPFGVPGALVRSMIG